VRRPITHHDLTGDQVMDELVVFYSVRSYRTPDYWPARGLIVSVSDFDLLARTVDPHPHWGPTASPFWGVRIFTAPDWTCEPDLVALARLIATLRRHRWYRRLEAILETLERRAAHGRR